MSYKDNAFHTLCVLHWCKDAQEAFAKASASYARAGSPGIPLGSRDYKKTFFKQRRKKVKESTS